MGSHEVGLRAARAPVSSQRSMNRDRYISQDKLRLILRDMFQVLDFCTPAVSAKLHLHLPVE